MALVSNAASFSSRLQQGPLGLPFAPITRPDQLFEDPHLLATGGLAPIELPDGTQSRVPLAPLSLNGQQPALRLQPPRVGQHTDEILRAAGYSDSEIESLKRRAIAQGEN